MWNIRNGIVLSKIMKCSFNMQFWLYPHYVEFLSLKLVEELHACYPQGNDRQINSLSVESTCILRFCI